MDKEKSCGAIVFRGKGSRRAYLMLYHKKGHLDFPKGHVSRGESEIETAKREIFEETGISSLSFVKGFRQKISYFVYKGGRKLRKESVFFLAKAKKASAVKISHEHNGFIWLCYKCAQGGLSYKNAKGLLKKAEKHLNAKKM